MRVSESETVAEAGCEVPEGWANADFLDVIDYEGGAQPPKSTFIYEPQKGYVRLLQIRDFGEKPFPTYVPDSPRLKKAGKHDLLLARYGGDSADDSLGRICSGLAGAYNVALVKLTFDPDLVHRTFVQLFFKGPWFKSAISVNSRSCQRGFNRDDLRWLKFPVAPRTEQLRVTEKAEQLLGCVSASRERLLRIPLILKRFRRAVLAAACSGRLTAEWRETHPAIESASALLERMLVERRNLWKAKHGARNYQESEPVLDEELPAIPETWCWTNFDHCSWEITVGHVGPMRDRYVSRGIPFLRSQNVRPLRFDPTGLVQIPSDFHKQLSKSKLEGGEILVVRSGANTGDCCVFPNAVGEANCADLVITRPLSGLCAEYAALYVTSPEGEARLSIRETGIAQPHFNIGAMRVKAFPLPPLEEQHEIVRRVEALFKLADAIGRRVAAATVGAEKLTEAILAKAFRGELVPTEAELARREKRAYESASALLSRIQAERKHVFEQERSHKVFRPKLQGTKKNARQKA